MNDRFKINSTWLYDNNDATIYNYLNVYIPPFEGDNNGEEYRAFKKNYQTHVDAHNKKILQSVYKDAGFDLLTPPGITCIEAEKDEEYPSTTMLDLGIQCSMNSLGKQNSVIPRSYFLYPRSSTGSKTKCRLANSVGIIDSGYRGNIKACVDCYKTIELTTNQRLFQLCSPNLTPLYVSLVETENDLNVLQPDDIDRKKGGFGSTGL